MTSCNVGLVINGLEIPRPTTPNGPDEQTNCRGCSSIDDVSDPDLHIFITGERKLTQREDSTLHFTDESTISIPMIGTDNLSVVESSPIK